MSIAKRLLVQALPNPGSIYSIYKSSRIFFFFFFLRPNHSSSEQPWLAIFNNNTTKPFLSLAWPVMSPWTALGPSYRHCFTSSSSWAAPSSQLNLWQRTWGVWWLSLSLSLSQTIQVHLSPTQSQESTLSWNHVTPQKNRRVRDWLLNCKL